MSHVRKDTGVETGEWADHLRPKVKKLVNKAERRAARRQIADEVSKCVSCGVMVNVDEIDENGDCLNCQKGCY